MKLFYETDYHLRTLDFDCFDRLTPTSILNSFQDVAGYHAEIINLGFDTMYNKGYYWVVVREKITMVKNPSLSSRIKVSTWPLKKGKIDFERNYMMTDEEGNVVAYGSSLWVLINKDTRRLTRAIDVDYEGEFIEKQNYTSWGKLDVVRDYINEFTYRVSFTDIDHNKHMNNARYADVLLNSINLDPKYKVIDLQIDFVNEAKLGDELLVKYKFIDNKYYFEATNEEKVCIRALMEVALNE